MPHRRLLFLMIGLSAMALSGHLAMALAPSDATLGLLNAAVPVAIAIGFGVLAFWIVATEAVMIWTPLVMFLANMAVFRGIGPLVYVFGSDATQAKIWAGAWGLSPGELFATHVLNLTGAAAVVAGICLVSLGREVGAARGRVAVRAASIPVAAMSLFLLGAIVRYGLVLPVSFGTGDTYLPGIVRNLRFLVDLGFALIAYLAVKRGGRWTVVFWLFFPPHLFTLVLEFKKSALVLGLMLPVLGAFLANGRLRGLIVAAALIGVLAVAMHPVVKSARAQMLEQSGEAFGATFSQRVDILSGLLSAPTMSEPSAASAKPEQVGWLRLSYAAQQAIAMRSYQGGDVRDTVSTAWQVFVPRLIWPEKPAFSSLSESFYRAITGAGGALAGVTVFADAYWNAGWGGVLVVGLLAGAFFGFSSRFAIDVVRRRDFVLLPVVFLAMDMALREMNGWILTGLFGPIPFLLAYLVVVQAGRRLSWRGRFA